MITGELKSNVDRVWDAFWSDHGGVVFSLGLDDGDLTSND
jgi:hypothetical protein